MQSRHALIIKRNLSTDEHIKDHSQTPHVHLRAGIDLGVEQLGGCEIERPAKGGEVTEWIVQVREAKVDDFDIAGLRDEDVFDLEVYGRSCGDE
jgi:hypothetical protein